jgi:signal transduction histidine kinase
MGDTRRLRARVRMRLATKLNWIMAAVLLAVLGAMALASLQVRGLQDDARIVNYTGLVRGGSQRLVKLHLAGRATEPFVEEIDRAVRGLRLGDPALGLPPPEDLRYVQDMDVVEALWAQLREAVRAGEAASELSRLSEELYRAADVATGDAAESSSRKVAAYRNGLLLLTVFSAATLVAAALLIHRGFARRVAELSRQVSRIAAGDLTVSLKVVGGDEIGLLARSTAEMVSRLKAMIAELSAARDRAEEGNRAKAEFLARVSHELRTPLNSIIGYTELVLDGLDGPVLPPQRASLEKVEAHGRRLLALIERVLDFSTFDDPELELDVSDFSPAEVLCRLDDLASAAAAKGLAYSVRVGEEVPDAVRGDVARTAQVLRNLVDNAVKFTETGSIEVRVESRPAGGKATCLRFVVADTGIGIPKDKLASIFQGFAQVEASLTRKHGGLGLGLAVSALLARKMEGRIWAESEEGRGSTFSFEACFERARGLPAGSRGSGEGCRSPPRRRRFGGDAGVEGRYRDA